MPRPKQAPGDTVAFDLMNDPTKVQSAHDDFVEDLKATVDEQRELLKFVARTIRTINTNGRPMTTKCRLCPQAKILREPCQHEAIWRLAGI